MSIPLRILLMLSVLGLTASFDTATAQMRSREIVPLGRDGHAPEGRGCYWANNRGSCRAYCYIEADGRRFCTERSRNAEPQAPIIAAEEAIGLLK